MAAHKTGSILSSLTVLALTACATSPGNKSAQAAASSAVNPHEAHQTPSNPNPDALPQGLIEWVDYVCSIPDPEARQQAIRDSEEQRGWTFTCPEEKPPPQAK
jgi:hypothetical protein